MWEVMWDVTRDVTRDVTWGATWDVTAGVTRAHRRPPANAARRPARRSGRETSKGGNADTRDMMCRSVVTAAGKDQAASLPVLQRGPPSADVRLPRVATYDRLITSGPCRPPAAP